MKHLHVYVDDEKWESIKQLISDNKLFYDIEPALEGIPEWHKTILNERIDNPSLEPRMSWEDAKKELAQIRNDEV